jgi:hypothetical protein
MEIYNNLRKLNGVAQVEGEKFFENSNKTAGRRLKKSVNGNPKFLHTEMRKEVSE